MDKEQKMINLSWLTLINIKFIYTTFHNMRSHMSLLQMKYTSTHKKLSNLRVKFINKEI